MADLVKQVPGVKWTTRRQKEGRYATRHLPAHLDHVIVILPASHADEGAGRNTQPQEISISRAKYEAAVKKKSPLRIFRSERKHRDFWAYENQVFVTSDQELRPDDVAALISEAANVRRLRLAKAHALQAMTRDLDSKARRPTIPQDVKLAVWQRDGGRCVECDSNEALEFDHIIPLALGGANTMRNLQLLCEACNRRKGATLG